MDPCPLVPMVDGLMREWGERVFVNPPYSQVKRWLEKARMELDSGRTKVAVFLTFSNTDTGWFHDYVLGKAEIRFLRGRLQFSRKDGKTGRAMRPSMVVVFRGDHG